MSDLTARFDALEDRVDGLEPRVSKIEDAIAIIKADLARVEARLASLATGEQVVRSEARLIAKIDSAVNGLLRDALAAEPAHRMRWWAAAGVFVAFGSMIVSLVAVLAR